MNKKRLLVVDEDPQVRDSLSDAFASEFDVLATRSLEEAIREATFNRPNCVVLDMDLAESGATLLCKILKSMKDTQSTPLILRGMKSRQEGWEVAKEMGAYDYLEKSLSPDQVLESVRRALSLPPVERRRSHRLLLRIPFVIRGKDNYDRDFELSSVTEGVSEHGLLVRLPARIPVGEEVEVFQSEPDDPDRVAILTRARVVWNDAAGVRGPYWHGLEFLKASPAWTSKD